MANDTTASGYLVPTASPVYDDSLDDLLHDAIMGISGISDGTLIRPRWQPEPPNQPAFDTNWVAFGIVRTQPDVFSYEGHDALGLGTSVVERDELLYVLHSFYGPDGAKYREQYRTGLQLSQNRDALRAAGIGVVEVQESVNVPALFKERWVRRTDVTIVFRRRVGWAYNVRNVLPGGNVGLDNGQYVTDLTI